MREFLPEARPNVAPNGASWQDPQWSKSVDAAEVARRREGCVGDDGIRRVRMVKTAPEFDDPRLFEQYQERGYTVSDCGYYYEMAIPQTEFERRENERISADLRRLAPQPKSPEFDRDEDEQLTPISATDL